MQENDASRTSVESVVRRPCIGDFDVYYQPCKHCGYDTGKSRVLDHPRCWKCGGSIQRDFSERALKKNGNTPGIGNGSPSSDVVRP